MLKIAALVWIGSAVGTVLGLGLAALTDEFGVWRPLWAIFGYLCAIVNTVALVAFVVALVLRYL